MSDVRRQEEVRIRLARRDDAPAIAAVNVRSWQTSYRGILPDSFLDALDAKVREEPWRERLAQPPEFGCTLVAEVNRAADEDASAIIGFATGGPERDGVSGYDGELYAIYLLAEYRGNGIGRRLTSAIAGWLSQRGTRSLLIWVLKENVRARGFYERLGGQFVAERPITIGSSNLQEVAYGWPDLHVISHANQDRGRGPDEVDSAR